MLPPSKALDAHCLRDMLCPMPGLEVQGKDDWHLSGASSGEAKKCPSCSLLKTQRITSPPTIHPSLYFEFQNNPITDNPFRAPTESQGASKLLPCLGELPMDHLWGRANAKSAVAGFTMSNINRSASSSCPRLRSPSKSHMPAVAAIVCTSSVESSFCLKLHRSMRR